MDTDARFAWTELTTTDTEKAARFYARILGWERAARPMRTPSGRLIEYSLFRVGERQAAGMYAMIRAQRQQGVQPSWISYVFVADAAETGARAVRLGGAVLVPPVTVLDLGRLSILRDPTGASVGLWQPGRLGHGFQTRGETGFPCWTEHVSPDPTRAARFYAELCGWTLREQGGVTVAELAGSPVAGLRASAPAAEVAPQWVSHFQVADCAASCTSVTDFLGTVLVPPASSTPTARAAIARDPQGVVFGLRQP